MQDYARRVEAVINPQVTQLSRMLVRSPADHAIGGSSPTLSKQRPRRTAFEVYY